MVQIPLVFPLRLDDDAGVERSPPRSPPMTATPRKCFACRRRPSPLKPPSRQRLSAAQGDRGLGRSGPTWMPRIRQSLGRRPALVALYALT